jgi:catechol 2,3-dioxygenase-like lactoylglutathione lyase family enzyme
MSDSIAARWPLLSAARAFYCDALGGRQVYGTASHERTGQLFFHVGGTLVATRPAGREDPITLMVHDPVAIAERCWDAGFTVQVRESGDATTIAVIDPFDLELELIPIKQQKTA